MAKKTKKMNQKYLIIALALGLALAGYYGYRKIVRPTSINQIQQGNDGNYQPKPNKNPVPPTRNIVPKKP